MTTYGKDGHNSGTPQADNQLKHSSDHGMRRDSDEPGDPWDWIDERELSAHSTLHSLGRRDLEEQLFYARSRGIREIVAKKMLLVEEDERPQEKAPAAISAAVAVSNPDATTSAVDEDDDYDPWDWINEEELDAHARMHMLGFTEFQEQMFYARSRGINEYVAKRVIIGEYI